MEFDSTKPTLQYNSLNEVKMKTKYKHVDAILMTLKPKEPNKC
jgi:hypothetical protein